MASVHDQHGFESAVNAAHGAHQHAVEQSQATYRQAERDAAQKHRDELAALNRGDAEDMRRYILLAQRGPNLDEARKQLAKAVAEADRVRNAALAFARGRLRAA